MATRKTPESYVLNACRDYLRLKGWDVTRMQSGAVQDRRGIPVRMHEKGTADLLAMRRFGETHMHRVIWIECKAPNGKQSPYQKEFQKQKQEIGQHYVVAYGIQDLENLGL